MTSPTYDVFDGDGVNPPARPTTDDFGGLQFQDHPTKPPTDRRRLASSDYMQLERAVAKLAHITRIATIDATWDGAQFTSVDAYSTSNESAMQAVVASEQSTGVYRFTWASGSLPARTSLPRPMLLAGTGLQAQLGLILSNSVDVEITNIASGLHVATACQFTLDLFGE